MNELDVWKKRTRSGVLNQESIHSYAYTYNEPSSLPVSISMPTIKLRREFNELPPAFQAFMPEGELLKAVVSYLEVKLGRNVGDMDVLAAVGNNNVGILSFTMPGQAIKPVNKLFSPDSINAADDELSAFNQAMGEFFLSGVSGVQPKFLAKSLPMNNLIVKSYDPYAFPASTVVEHMCMELAAKLGIDVAKTTLSKQGHVLFVERFDKQGDDYGDMEEICSVLSLGTSKKYDGTYEHIAKAIGRIDGGSLRPFFKQIVFHNLVRNGDAHLKNFAILDGKLSPMYDVLCTAAWGDHQLALYLGGTKKWVK
ncbi:MAG: type II toxin-antitoxin system HipA family toxin, partial [Mariprofundaceae bacterium]|nr:type II toxin-antitoxin system HipA family toxin [Mariprofundaceae bacterium]